MTQPRWTDEERAKWPYGEPPVNYGIGIQQVGRYAQFTNTSRNSVWVFAKDGQKIEIKPGESTVIEI